VPTCLLGTVFLEFFTSENYKTLQISSNLSLHLFGSPSLRNFPKSSTLLVHLDLLNYFEPESRPGWSLQLVQHNDARAQFLY